MAKKSDDVIAWLRDAHAMEAATVDNLGRLIGYASRYPALKARLERHLEASRRQQSEIEAELKKLGSDTSTLKDLTMRFTGRIQPLLAGLSSDDVPKNCIAGHAWEHFEIASYRSLHAAADEVGMTDLRELCERFMQEEEEMADFFLQNLAEVTRQHLKASTTA
jgi:ferritin-like metal-binding protein YciE